MRMQIQTLLLIGLIAVSVQLQAQTAQLQIAGDLMVHPNQVADFFTLASQQINSSTGWDWPSLQFTKPYKTAWSQVQAQGPFAVTFTTDGLASQVVGFELDWNDPRLHIGQFQIDDTITRSVGGATIVIHLAGQCSGMTVAIPSGQWKVKGHLSWSWVGSTIQVQWLDFAFTRNGAAVASADLGQCVGPQGLPAALQQAFTAIAQDSSWLQDVLREGVLNWVQNSLGQLQTELLKARTITLKPGMDLAWQPEGLSGVGAGLVRVAGHLSLSRSATKASVTNLDRSFTVASLSSVKESGFVLPKSTLQSLLGFLYSTGDLQYRVQSDQVSGFQSLMQSRFLQFFVWPDLMNFAKSALFYFDVTTSQVPRLSRGATRDGGGVAYDVRAPLLVHQWAPAGTQYLPYVDFTSSMSGRMEAFLQDQNLILQMTPDDLSLSESFRAEYQDVRSVNTWIATSLLGSNVQSYLSSKQITVALPSWQLGTSLSLSIKDVQVWRQSFRVPLQFRNSN